MKVWCCPRVVLWLLCLPLAFLLVAAGEPVAAPPACPEGEARRAPELHAILLGTGYPRPDPDRAGPSTAVLVGDNIFIVDVGRGVTQRFWATGLEMKNVRAVFLTHLHSDHTAGLPDFFNTSWIFGRSDPLELYGPPGTPALARAMLDFFAVDIPIRRDLEMHPAEGATVNSHVIKEGVVYRDADVRVTAFRVNHEPVRDAFGFRFDLLRAPPCATDAPPASPSDTSDEQGSNQSSAPDSFCLTSLVISGDTRPSDNLVKFARGADLLIHEAYLPEHFDKVDTPEVAARLKAYHSSAEEAAQVAARAGVKALALTHLVPGDPDSEKIFLERARPYFSGPIFIGPDLMKF